MSVISIEKIIIDDDYVTVNAIVENMRLRYSSTYYEPEEWEPALSSSSFYLSENEELPTDDEELLNYINSLDLDWNILIE
jgi:hypothetical protein